MVKKINIKLPINGAGRFPGGGRAHPKSRTRPAPRSRFVADPLLWICVEMWISGAKTATREQERGASVPCSYRSMSLESAPDRSYDVPPADERKGKTRAESDRRLGNLIVTHRSTIIRYPAGTMAPPRQKNVAGMKLLAKAGSHPTYERRVTRSSPCGRRDRPAHDNGERPGAWAAFLDSANGHRGDDHQKLNRAAPHQCRAAQTCG
jgi:hypothetical protein